MAKQFLLSLLLLTQAWALPLNKLKLPSNFRISIYARVPNARSLTLGSHGIVFVGTRTAGKVYVLVPAEHNVNVIQIAKGLNMPNGVAYRNGDLYIAEVHRILRYQNIEQHLNDPPPPVVISNTLPRDKHHGWRYIGFGPDGWLYVAIGAPCNVCVTRDPIYATIIRMRPNGSDQQVYVKGVRNSVGFAWDPATDLLWFTENGRDWLGDNLPPDELNIATQPGLHFGFPHVYGNNTPDKHFYRFRPLGQTFTTPALNLPAHAAALGMVFYNGTMFPKKYHNQIFIAEHGSWNRSKKTGYQIIWVTHDGNQVINSQPFITGWLQGEHDWGRPVDLLVMPDGSLLVSDDKAGVVYQVSYMVKS